MMVVNTPAMTFSLQCCRKKAKPKPNKATDRWEPSPADDGEYPYDTIGALLRHDPLALFNCGEYEQFILNYTSRLRQWDRAEVCQPVDWLFQKMEEKKGKPK
mmetsp:Transcript_25925/g.63449  ORF Transcript_25925/g.63449 Transcript_25925/m.63449 type:complete len:102 (-) Transcript_25925:33-338(-)